MGNLLSILTGILISLVVVADAGFSRYPQDTVKTVKVQEPKTCSEKFSYDSIYVRQQKVNKSLDDILQEQKKQVSELEKPLKSQ